MKMYRTYKITIAEHLLCFSWSSENPACVYADAGCDSAGHASDAPMPMSHEDLVSLHRILGDLITLASRI